MERFTVGIGGDYTRWSDAWYYLMGIPLLLDDYEFRQISNILENHWPTVGAGNLDMNGHSVKFYCAWEDSHQGDPTKGFVTTLDGTRGRISMRTAAPYVQADTCIVENLWLQKTGFLTGGIGILGAGAWGAGSPITINFNNLLITGEGNGDGIDLPGKEAYVEIYNCKIWNVDTGIACNAGGSGTAYPGRRVMENVTSGLNSDFGLVFSDTKSSEWVVRNCVAYNNTTSDWKHVGGPGYIKFFNCADSDGTAEGVGVIHNIVPGDEFQYHLLADEGEANFLKLVDGTVTRDGYTGYGQLGRSGAKVTLSTTDIAGKARP